MADRHNPPRGWRGTQAGGTPTTGASARPAGATNKRKQIFTVLAVMLALAGGVAGILYLLRPAPRPYFMPVFIPEYTQKQIPVNFQAEADRQALRNGEYFDPANTFASEEKDLFRVALANLKGRPLSDAVVLYVCAFAQASAGDILLLPGDFNPDNPPTAVKLREVLEKLRDCPAKNKLLVLDTMRPLADARLGVLTNDVAVRIREEVQNAKVPHLITLLSCSPGQVSLGSEDLGRSVFGYYFEEGLRGWADGWGGKRDGHVSAQELAEFVRRRVDRWAQQNRGTRQTPLLLPENAAVDFHMVALEHGHAREELPPPELAEYPKLLKDAWQVRDDAWVDVSLAPRAFRELEAYLLRAEFQWRAGMGLERLKEDLRGPKGQLDRFEAQLREARRFFLSNQVEPRSLRSLTLARALGEKPDRAVADTLKALLPSAADVSKEKQTEAANALAKFSKDNKDKQFDVACAAFDLAINDPNLTADKLRVLTQVLKSPEFPLRYVETVLLTNSLSSWPVTIAQQALEVARKGETAISRPQVLPWLRPQIEDAAQNRHIAEVYLASPNCVSAREVEKQLQTAAKKYDQVLAKEEILIRAQRCLDEALVRLPAYLPYLEIRTPPNDEGWQRAAQFGLELREALVQYPKQKLADSDLNKKLADINQKAESLRAQLDDLRRPFDSDLSLIMKRSGQADAPPSLCAEIEAMLATPMLKINDRNALWNAGRKLSGELNRKTMTVDQKEDNDKEITKLLSESPSDQERWQREERMRAAHRARWAIALLKLSGLSTAEAHSLDESLRQVESSPDTSAWDSLAALLRKAWVEDIPRKLKDETNLAAKDRLNVPYPPFDTLVNDRDSPNDFLLNLNKELKQWLTRWYGYENQDLPSSGFYADALREYSADTRLSPARNEALLQFAGPTQVPSLTPENPSTDITLKLKLSEASSSQPIDVNILTADDKWLQVNPDKSNLPAQLPIHVTLKSAGQNAATPPPQGLGFLVQARVNDRVFHHRVSVPLVPIPEIILSTNPVEPKDPVTSQLALRPGKEPLKYYLYVRNPTNKPQKLVIELLDDRGPIEGGIARIPDPQKPNDTPLQPNKTRRIDFGKPAANNSLKEFHGPLQIRLRDADANDEILDTKKIDVQISNPIEYMEVSNIQFDPEKRQVLVKVQSKKDLPEPGCQVDLVLPTDGRIPGYTGVAKDRKDTEKLTQKEVEKELSISGIELDEGSDPDGRVYLTVDGVERAFIFKTTFKRAGSPTTPEPFMDPDIRIQAPAYAIPSDKFTVKANVDNPPEGATVLLELLEDGTFNPQKASKPVAARHRYLGISSQSSDGALLFEAQIDDPVIALDTRGIAGKRILRASLRDSEAKLVKPPFDLPITLDDSPPKNLDAKGEPVGKNMVEATAKAEDRESGIRMVRFYVGKLDGEGKKPPAGVTPLDAKFDEDKKVWTKMIPITQPGEVDLTAEFENGVGLKAYSPFKVTMNAGGDGGDSGGGEGKPGSISGTVELNNRLQKSAKVTLEGGPLKKPLEENTDDDGKFKFPKVPPGTYKLSAVTKDGKAKGNIEVTVEAGKAKDNVTIIVRR